MPNEFSLRFPQPVNTAIDFSSGLDKIAVAIAAKKERERMAAKDAEYARQNDINEQRLRMQDAEHQQDRAASMSAANGSLAGKLGELVRGKRFAEADVLAASSQYTDPRTGQMVRPTYDRGDPGEPQQETPGFDGLMKALPMWGGVHEVVSSQPGMEGFGKAMKFGGRPARNPSVTTATGQRVEFDPGEMERAEQAKNEEKKSKAMAMLQDPQMAPVFASKPQIRDALLLQAGLVGAGADGAMRGQVANAEGREDAQAFSAGQNELNRANAVKLKGMSKGSGGPKASDVRGDKRLGLQEEAQARLLAKDVLSGLGFKEVQAQNRKFNDMAAAVSANPNAALDAVTAGSFVKMAQGGTGVISDSDMEQFWNRIGGVGDKSAQWVENVLSGKIDQDKRAKVAEAVKWLASQAGNNLKTIRGSMEYAFSKSPNLSSYGAQMTGIYFPEARQEATAGGKSGGDPAKRAALIDFAKKNPGDPRSAAILKKYGLQ